MFDNISQKISKIFDSLAGKKNITEEDFNLATRELRIALIEADVSLEIVKSFIEQIKEKAIGQQVIKSVNAGQMIVKIVYDQLVELLGSDKSILNLNQQPTIIMLVGLQAAGKTTTAGKIARYLSHKQQKKVLLVSLDIYRPAAQQQLAVLANQVAVDSLPIIENQKPLEITARAIENAHSQGYDVVILDTAGRTAINSEMMHELSEIKKLAKPQEILLTVDAMIGQDAINIAKAFHEKLDLSGIILTRLDGDSRGGAALTMRAVTDCPIKFIGTGEKLDEFEEFNPQGIASRIIGMGDVLALVEKAQEVVDKKEAEKAAEKIRKGQFDLDDLLSQIRQMKKMGGLSKILNFIPGAGKIKEMMPQLGEFEQQIKSQEALILSMTPKERRKPEILNTSRKVRIAKGAGSNIQEVNRLLKKYKQMQKMVGKMGKLDEKQIKEMMANSGLGGF